MGVAAESRAGTAVDGRLSSVAGGCVDSAQEEPVGAVADAVAAGRMPVVEKFVSVNGEGPRAGRLAAFVRFAGCNLRCSYCDTMWANEPGCPAEWLAVDDVAAWVASTPAACVTLTGGEPALQPLLPQLVRALMALPPAEDGAGGKAPRAVEIETNGAVDLAELAAVRRELREGADSPEAARDRARGASPGAALGPQAPAQGAHRGSQAAVSQGAGPGAVPGPQTPAQGALCGSHLLVAPSTTLHFTMDWKLPGSGMGDRMLEGNLALLGPDDTVKFVAGSEEDLREMARIVRANGLCERCAVYASPVFGRIEPARIVAFLQEERLARVTLQLQLQKIIWPSVERGV